MTSGHKPPNSNNQKGADLNHAELSPGAGQNGRRQEAHRRQVLASAWGKGTLVHCWWERGAAQPPWEAVRRYRRES